MDEPVRGPDAGQRLDEAAHRSTGTWWMAMRNTRQGLQRSARRSRSRPPPAPPGAGASCTLPHAHAPRALSCWTPSPRPAGSRSPAVTPDPQVGAPARSAPHPHGPAGTCGTVSSGCSFQARCDPGAPGCLPGRFPDPPRFRSRRLPARQVIRRGRHRGVARVPRNQPLQPRHPPRQLRVLRLQLLRPWQSRSASRDQQLRPVTTAHTRPPPKDQQARGSRNELHPPRRVGP